MESLLFHDRENHCGTELMTELVDELIHLEDLLDEDRNWIPEIPVLRELALNSIDDNDSELAFQLAGLIEALKECPAKN